MTMIIDGVEWSATALADSLHLTAVLVEKSKAETQSGKIHRKITGTRYSYGLRIVRGPAMTDAQWEEFFMVLSAPVEYHEVTLPFPVNGTQTFRAYIETVELDLIDQIGDYSRWSDIIDLTFTPEEPQRRTE